MSVSCARHTSEALISNVPAKHSCSVCITVRKLSLASLNKENERRRASVIGSKFDESYKEDEGLKNTLIEICGRFFVDTWIVKVNGRLHVM